MIARGAWILALVSLVAACAGSGSGKSGGGGKKPPACKPPQTPSVSYQFNVQPIYDVGCALAGCHLGPSAVNQLNLAPGQSYGDTVNQPVLQKPGATRVVPGKPDQSYLLQKILNTPGITGTIMPQGCPGAPLAGAQCLTADQVQAIRTWITECAPNN